MKTFILSLLGAVAVLSASPSAAQGYPSRPIRVIVPLAGQHGTKSGSWEHRRALRLCYASSNEIGHPSCRAYRARAPK
jgi:hypothetical protein